MGLDLQKLEDLKEKMQVEEDFGTIWKFFFDHFGENPEFMALGARADETMRLFLEPILESICKTVGQPRSDGRAIHPDRTPRSEVLSWPLSDRRRHRRRILFRGFEDGDVFVDARTRIRAGPLRAVFDDSGDGQRFFPLAIEE